MPRTLSVHGAHPEYQRPGHSNGHPSTNVGTDWSEEQTSCSDHIHSCDSCLFYPASWERSGKGEMSHLTDEEPGSELKTKAGRGSASIPVIRAA